MDRLLQLCLDCERGLADFLPAYHEVGQRLRPGRLEEWIDAGSRLLTVDCRFLKIALSRGHWSYRSCQLVEANGFTLCDAMQYQTNFADQATSYLRGRVGVRSSLSWIARARRAQLPNGC